MLSRRVFGEIRIHLYRVRAAFMLSQALWRDARGGRGILPSMLARIDSAVNGDGARPAAFLRGRSAAGRGLLEIANRNVLQPIGVDMRGMILILALFASGGWDCEDEADKPVPSHPVPGYAPGCAWDLAMQAGCIGPNSHIYCTPEVERALQRRIDIDCQEGRP